MSIFDPMETQRIAEWLDEGEAMQAANALLTSQYRDHKSLRPLVVQCIRQLMELAQRAHAKGDLETAANHSRPAGELISLSGENAELAATIEAELAENDRQERMDLDDLNRGRQLHANRRLQTAFEHHPTGCSLAQCKTRSRTPLMLI